MSGISIERRGLDSVMQGLDTFKCPYFSVWQKKDLKFSNTDEDEASSHALLQENLEALQECGSTLVYTIRFHKKLDADNYISDKTPYVGSFNFKICDNEGYAQIRGVGGDNMPAIRPVANQVILDKLTEMEAKITQLQAKPVDDDEPVDKLVDRIDAIGAVIEQNPFIQNFLTQLFGNMFGNNKTQPGTGGGGLAGVTDEDDAKRVYTDEEKITWAIEALKKADADFANHIVVLAHMAIKNPGKFKNLLMFL